MIDAEIMEKAERIANKLVENVVEVVRCKDCIYWREQGYCSRFDFQNMCPVAKEGAMHMPMDADDFCSRGERAE